MSWKCPNCQGFLTEPDVFVGVCPSCSKLFDKPISSGEITAGIKSEILATKKIGNEQLTTLKSLDKCEAVNLFQDLYLAFIDNKELDQEEVNVLNTLKSISNLSNEDVNYQDNILPYLYVLAVRTNQPLPVVDVQISGSGPVILKKDEKAHCVDNAVLKEIRSVSLGYEGGSRGVSFRIMKGVSYRIGSHRGHLKKEDQLVETSRGILFLTGKRLFFHPNPGNKPLSLPLGKIFSYNCFENGLEIYKDGREKGYFFVLAKKSSAEIFGICLAHLLAQTDA